MQLNGFIYIYVKEKFVKMIWILARQKVIEKPLSEFQFSLKDFSGKRIDIHLLLLHVFGSCILLIKSCLPELDFNKAEINFAFNIHLYQIFPISDCAA